jgi:hypothetical protein
MALQVFDEPGYGQWIFTHQAQGGVAVVTEQLTDRAARMAMVYEQLDNSLADGAGTTLGSKELLIFRKSNLVLASQVPFSGVAPYLNRRRLSRYLAVLLSR